MNTDFVADLTQYLQDNAIGSVGNDIFIGDLPDTIHNGMILVSKSSLQQNLYLDIREIDVDFWTRNIKAQDGYNLLLAVRSLLHLKGNFLTDNFYVWSAFCIGYIDDMDRDAEDRKVYKLQMRFITRALDGIS